MKKKNDSHISDELLAIQASLSLNCKNLSKIKDNLIETGKLEKAANILNIEVYLLEIQQKILSLLEADEVEKPNKNKNVTRYKL